MYISEELHEMLWQYGLWWLGMLLAFIFIFLAVARVVETLRERMPLRDVRKLAQIKKAAQRTRDERRKRHAMKVFNKPLTRWSETR